MISAYDAAYALLELWFDRNHNGVSEPDELSPLSELVSTIDLDYSPHRRVDGHGNEFRYRAKTYLTGGNVRHAYDVFFVQAP